MSFFKNTKNTFPLFNNNLILLSFKNFSSFFDYYSRNDFKQFLLYFKPLGLMFKGFFLNFQLLLENPDFQYITFQNIYSILFFYLYYIFNLLFSVLYNLNVSLIYIYALS